MKHQNTNVERREFLGLSAALLGTAALGIGGCASPFSKKSVNTASSGDNEGIVITDQAGRTTTFKEAPKRICTCIIPLPSIFFAVMGEDNPLIVGCNPASLPVYKRGTLEAMYPSLAQANTDWCARDFNVNIEALLALKPDVVFQWTFMPESIKKMEDAGLKVIALKYGTVDDLKTWITVLSTLMQKKERGTKLLSYFDKEISRVSERIATLPKSEWPVALHVTNSLKVMGKGFTSYLMDQSGAIDPTRDMGERQVSVNMEQVMQWNPQFIFVGNFNPIKASDFYNNTFPGQDWSHIPAVQNKHVYRFPVGGFPWDPPCVESPLTVKWLAHLMHPEMFKDMNMRAEVSQFYKDIYNYNLTEEQITKLLDHTQD